MLKINKLTDYATVILSYLAAFPDKIASAAEIARSLHISTPTVSKVLKILSNQQLVKSFRGTEGGYQLARSAEDITVAEIVSAFEGDLAVTQCCSHTNACVLDSLCAIKENWKIINDVIRSTLSGLTLSDMCKPLPRPLLNLRGIPIKVQANQS